MRPRYDRTRTVRIINHGMHKIAVCSCGYFQRRRITCRHIFCVVKGPISTNFFGVKHTKLYEAYYNRHEQFTQRAELNIETIGDGPIVCIPVPERVETQSQTTPDFFYEALGKIVLHPRCQIDYSETPASPFELEVNPGSALLFLSLIHI